MPRARRFGKPPTSRYSTAPQNKGLRAIRSQTESDSWTVFEGSKITHSGLTTEEKDRVLRGEKLNK